MSDNTLNKALLIMICDCPGGDIPKTSMGQAPRAPRDVRRKATNARRPARKGGVRPPGHLPLPLLDAARR